MSMEHKTDFHQIDFEFYEIIETFPDDFSIFQKEALRSTGFFFQLHQLFPFVI